MMWVVLLSLMPRTVPTSNYASAFRKIEEGIQRAVMQIEENVKNWHSHYPCHILTISKVPE